MYTWIQSTFGVGDGLARGLAFAASLVVVLTLIALFVFIVKRLAGSRISSVRSRQPRLAIMDTASVDTRRRLVLVRRDNVEHLLMIGGPSDVVVEQGIVRGTPVAATHPRPQPVLQAVGGQVQNGDAATPADLAPAQLLATAPAPAAPEPHAPVEAATAQTVQPAPAQTAANTVVAPEPAPTKNVSSLRARLAELKKTPNPFADKKAAAPQEPVASPQPTPARTDARPLQASRNGPATAQEPQPAGPGSTGGTPNDKASLATVQPRVAPRPIQSRVSTPSVDRKVTPPSSGPAANARTVVRPDTRREPVAGAATAAPAAAAANAPVVEMQSADVKPAAAVQTEKAPAPSPPPGVAETKPAPAAAAPSAESKPAVQEATSGAPAVTAGDPGGSASTAKAPGETRASQPAAPATREAEAGKAAPDTGKPAEDKGSGAKPDSANAASEAEQTGEKPQTAPETQTASQTPSQSAEKQAETEQTDPSAEANPIEDEMAKLLDEIHGTQKT